MKVDIRKNDGRSPKTSAPADPNAPVSDTLTRRECISALTAAPTGLALSAALIEATSETAHAAPDADKLLVPIEIRVNGRSHSLTIDPRVTLLDLLREHLKLTGTKKGCDHGQCGACTVLLHGRRINSCLTLAVSHDGDEITTVEGLASAGELHPLQSAFIDQDGFQCGYCTPGQLCSAVALLDEAHRGDPSFVTRDLTRTGPAELTAAEIRERMSGNICRCGAYPGIVAAVAAVAQAGGLRSQNIPQNERVKKP